MLSDFNGMQLIKWPIIIIMFIHKKIIIIIMFTYWSQKHACIMTRYYLVDMVSGYCLQNTASSHAPRVHLVLHIEHGSQTPTPLAALLLTNRSASARIGKYKQPLPPWTAPSMPSYSSSSSSAPLQVVKHICGYIPSGIVSLTVWSLYFVG